DQIARCLRTHADGDHNCANECSKKRKALSQHTDLSLCRAHREGQQKGRKQDESNHRLSRRRLKVFVARKNNAVVNESRRAESYCFKEEQFLYEIHLTSNSIRPIYFIVTEGLFVNLSLKRPLQCESQFRLRLLHHTCEDH